VPSANQIADLQLKYAGSWTVSPMQALPASSLVRAVGVWHGDAFVAVSK
jgi:hypothetical protein